MRSWLGRLVHQQLFEQLVVMVGELLEHLGAGFGLALLEVGGNVDPLAILAGPVVEGAFQREIDEAGDLVAFADRDLAGDQRRHAHRLQRGEEVADAAVGLVDAVDENQVRDAELVEHAQGRGGERRRAGSGSTTMIAMSASATARAPSAAKPIEPGLSMMAKWSPR